VHNQTGFYFMAIPNLAVLETYLKDIIVSKESIITNIENRDHIFEIKDEEKILGFISLYDLKAYVFEHEEEAKNYAIKNIDQNEWKNIYEHPYFQRRKPQLVSINHLKDADDLEFFILHKGQKSGPFEKFELLEKVESREILLSDMVSFNGGYTWIKLYQVDGFERRSLRDSTQLPGMPSNEFLSRPAESIHNIGETVDAMTSLAYLGNQKKGIIQERQHEVSYMAESNKPNGASSIYKWLLIVSICGIIYFAFNIKSNLSSPFKGDQTNSTGEQSEALSQAIDPIPFTENSPSKPINTRINDQRRIGKFESRRINPVRPAPRKSFMETKRSPVNTDSIIEPPGEDNNYFYDNTSPMELDPVRSQISKENYDNGGETSPANAATPAYSEDNSN
jgi:hypothetical protein